jgi:RHS repeat-associated protein
VVLGDNPSVYYRLEEAAGPSAVDSSTNHHDGSYSGHIAYHQRGALAGSSDFSIGAGASGNVTAADAGLPVGRAARTLEAWINIFTSGCCNSALIGSYGAAGTGLYFSADIFVDSQFHLRVNTDQGSVPAADWIVPRTWNNGWHLWDVTYDGNVTLSGYMDGQIVGKQTLAVPLNTSIGQFTTASASVDGFWDEIAVYPVALSWDRIDSHWSVGASTLPPCPTPPPTSPYAQNVMASQPSLYLRMDDIAAGGGPPGGPTPGSPVAHDYSGPHDSLGHCANAAYTDYGPSVSGPGAIVNDPDTAMANRIPGNVTANGGALPLGHHARTVEVWTKITTDFCAGSEVLIGSYGGSGTGRFFSVGLYVGCDSTFHLRVQTDQSSNPAADWVVPSWNDLQWHLWDVTYDDASTTLAGYMDGRPVGSQPIPMPLKTSVGQFTTALAGVDGFWDEVAVYPSALGPNQIAGHEALGAGTGPLGGPPTSAENAPTNPSELPACACQGSTAKPVNTESGVFSHTFADLSVPGRGVPLGFSHSYNSFAAGSDSPLGFGWSEPYSMSLAVDGSGNVTVTQENGSQVVFTNSGGTLTPPPRVIATLVKYGVGSYTFTRGAREIFDFNASGQLVDLKDLNGYMTTLAYSAGQLATVTDPAGRKLSFTWVGSHITTVTDPLVRSVFFGYDGSGNLVDVTDVAGGNTHFTYDPNHLLWTMRIPNQNPAVGGDGTTVTNHYDGQGRVDTQTDQLNRATTFVYAGNNSSGAGGTTTITDPKGNVVVETYTYGERVSITKGFGTAQAATWKYFYDPATLGVSSVTDPNGHTSTRSYDASGNVLTLTDALGRQSMSTYNGLNELLTAKDPLGVSTTMTYDPAGNLKTRSRPLTGGTTVQTTTLHYDDTAHPGDVTSMTDPDGKVWIYGYDANGDRSAVTDPLGNKSTSQYNNVGWVTSTVSARGNATGANPALFTTSYTHNKFGQVLVTKDPLGHTTINAYDPDRNLVSFTDGNHKTTIYSYDDADQQTVIHRPDTTTLGSDYWPDGTLKDLIDGRGNPTSYGYDPLARLTSVTDPLNRTTSYTHDGAGNTMTITDPQSQVTTMGYDAANQPTSTAYSDGVTPNITQVSYDADGQRLSVAYGASGTQTWRWDSLHRMTSSADGTTKVSYGYDPKGQLTNIVYPGGSKVVKRRYDGAGRLIQVKDWLGNTIGFGYDRDGNLTTQTTPGAVVDTSSYDNADRLTAISDATAGVVFARFGYNRDGANLVTKNTDTGVPAPTTNKLTYDANQRLATDNAVPYGYDAADNLIQTLSGAQQAFDAANQLCWSAPTTGTCATPPAGATTYIYNARGDRTTATPPAGSPTSYGWDQANRLTAYTSPTAAATYGYNADGLRISKSVGAAHSFTWDKSPSLPLLLQNVTSAGTTDYVYGPSGAPVEQIAGTTVSFLHHVQLGSIRALTNTTGAVVATKTFDPYGNITGTTGSATSAFGFAGEYTDDETGFIYLRARYYDPTTAQFLTRDPMVASTRSPYAYVGGNPLNATDPSGRCGLWGDDTCLGDAAGAINDHVIQPTVDLATHLCFKPTSGNSCESGANAVYDLQRPDPGKAYKSTCFGVWIASWCNTITADGSLYMAPGVSATYAPVSLSQTQANVVYGPGNLPQCNAQIDSFVGGPSVTINLGLGPDAAIQASGTDNGYGFGIQTGWGFTGPEGTASWAFKIS